MNGERRRMLGAGCAAGVLEVGCAAGVIEPAGAMVGTAVEPARFRGFAYRGLDEPPPLPEGHFRNPVLAGFHPDPTICRTGSDYWLVTSSFVYFPGLPVYHSRNLADWRLVGHAIDRPGQLRYAGIGVSRGLFAPALSWHRGLFHLVCTMVDGGGNFLVTAENPAGPWSDPQWLPFEGIDPSLFFDDDGRAWMLNNGAPEGPPRYDGHRAIWLQRWDADSRRLVGERRVLVDGGADPQANPVWIEGPHLLKRDGWYILCAAEGGTSVRHSQVVFRSRRVEGHYEPWAGNPILTQRDLDGSVPGAVTCTGHAQLVTGPDGQWWATFLGCRPGPAGFWLTGRETFVLPVRWTIDGWPQILPPRQRVPLTVPAPRGAALAPPPPPRFDDRFDGPVLQPGWFTLRSPERPWWRLDDGGLVIEPRADALGGRGQPSALFRRIEHAAFEARLVVEPPSDSGVASGLVLFQSERQHLFVAVGRGADGVEAAIEWCRDGRTDVIGRRALPSGDGAVELRIVCDGRWLRIDAGMAGERFPLVSATGGERFPLAGALDARSLSVQAAGGGLHFTGAVIGPHARAPQAAARGRT